IQVAHGFEDLARALRRKLLLEISDATPPSNPLLVKVAASSRRSSSHATYEKGCDIGERMRYGGVGFDQPGQLYPPYRISSVRRREIVARAAGLNAAAIAVIFLNEQSEILVHCVAQQLVTCRAFLDRDQTQRLVLHGRQHHHQTARLAAWR